MSAVDDLYQQTIIEYNRSPRNFRRIEKPTHTARGVNPLCGDEYCVYLTVNAEGVIEDAAYDGSGCAISKASGSLMTAALKGQTMEKARLLFEGFHQMVLGKYDAKADSCGLGKLCVFQGVWRYPARVKCAALCWHAMKAALDGEGAASTEDTM